MALQRSSEPHHPALVTVLEIRDDQSVLAPEVPIERHLRYPSLLDDTVDPGATDAVAVEKIVRGEEDTLARWEHEAVLEAMQARLYQMPQASRIRRQTVEHAFGTLKAWMGATHFLTKTLPRVSTEMSLHVLAYNLKRAMQLVGIVPLMEATRG
jgi:hypothetical protein